jgi:hypothetical protein
VNIPLGSKRAGESQSSGFSTTTTQTPSQLASQQVSQLAFGPASQIAPHHVSHPTFRPALEIAPHHVSQAAFRPGSQMASPHVSQLASHPVAQAAFRPCLEIASQHVSKSMGVATSIAHSARNAAAATQPIRIATPHAYRQNVSNSSYP